MTFIWYLTHSWPMFSFQIPWKHQKIGGLIRKRFPNNFSICRSSCPEVFLGKDVLKICSKFIGQHPCGSVLRMSDLLYICCIFSEHVFLGTPMSRCFWSLMETNLADKSSSPENLYEIINKILMDLFLLISSFLVWRITT